MGLLPSPLIQKVSPAEFVTRVAGPLSPFMQTYGDAPLLCVGLGQGGSQELEAGLIGASDPDGSGTQTLAFHTVVADAGAVPARAMHGFSASDVGRLLATGRFFVLPLAKRSQESISLERISVGRARNKDIVLRDGSVSKFHGWFEVADDGRVQLADAGSKNGTSVDGDALPAKTLTEVAYGATIKIGNVAAFVCEPAVLWEALH